MSSSQLFGAKVIWYLPIGVHFILSQKWCVRGSTLQPLKIVPIWLCAIVVSYEGLLVWSRLMTLHCCYRRARIKTEGIAWGCTSIIKFELNVKLQQCSPCFVHLFIIFFQHVYSYKVSTNLITWVGLANWKKSTTENWHCSLVNVEHWLFG